MNKMRRKALEELAEKIADLQNELEEIKQEEEDYKDNMPENLQSSERYEIADAACEAMDSAISALQDAYDYTVEAAG